MSDSGRKMLVWEHLEELRWTLFKIIGTLVVAAIIAFFYVDSILDLLLSPIRTIQENNPEFVLKQVITGPFDAVMIKMKTSFLAAVAGTYPILLYFIWAFIRPGIKKRENSAFLWICVSGTFSFALGVVCGYLLIAPIFSILLKFSISTAENLWTVANLVNFIFYWLLGAGIVFELPLAMLVLTKMEVIEIALFRKIRPYFVIAALVIAAIVTPPDPFTMLLVGIPFILLYEVGIFVASLS